MITSFFKTNIFIVDYTSASPQKYIEKNLELCEYLCYLFILRYVWGNCSKIRKTVVSSQLTQHTFGIAAKTINMGELS